MKNFFKWIFSHKILTLFISISVVALAMLVPAIISGTITHMLAVEVMSVGSLVGLTELGIFGLHELRVNSLRKKEVDYANKLLKSNANKNLTKTLNKKQAYKICKKFARVQLKLAEKQKTSKKALSFSYRPLRFASNHQTKTYNKTRKLQTQLNLKYLEDLNKNKISKSQRKLNRKLEKMSENVTYNFEDDYAPYRFKKSLTLPIGNKKIYDERYSINCYKLETVQTFEEMVKDLPFSKKQAGDLTIHFNEDSRLKPIALTIVPEKKLLRKCTSLVLEEVKDIAYDNKNTFPVQLEYTTKNGTIKNKIIEDEIDLENLINKLGTKEKTQENDPMSF